MEEYFVGTEGGELSFLESDGNILVDQGQNIQQAQAPNVVYTPTQLYFVQGSESIPSEQCIIGGETQTLYTAPVPQENLKLDISKQPSEQVIPLQIGQEVGGGHSQVISIQRGGTTANKLIQRNISVQQNNAVQGVLQVQPSLKQKMQIVQPQLCLASSLPSQNGQIIDHRKRQAPSQPRIVRNLSPAALQQVIGQSGKYVMTNKNMQGVTQLKVQHQIPNVQRVSSIADVHQPIAIQVQQTDSGFQVHQATADIQLQQNATGLQVQQNPHVIQTLKRSRAIQLPQNSPGFALQQFPVATSVQQNLSAIPLQKFSPAQHQVAAVKGEHSISNVHLRLPSNLNVQNNQIVAQVRPGIGKPMKPTSSCISITNKESLPGPFVIGAQPSTLSNSSGGYVVQANKRPVGQAVTLSNATILLQCMACKTLVDKPEKCPKCGGGTYNKFITTPKTIFNKPEGKLPTSSTITSATSKINMIHQTGNSEKMVQTTNKIGTNEALKETEFQNQLQKDDPEDKKAPLTRTKGKGRAKGKGRGKGRIPEEPVILTLSSDEEGEEKKESKEKSVTQSPPNAPLVLHPKEPIIKSEITSPLDPMLLRTVTQPLNLDLGATYATLQCRNIRIGSYRTVPTKKVIFSSTGISLVVSPVSRGNPPVSVLIPIDRIFKILVHFGASLPVFFLYVKPQLAACIRHVLGLNDPTKEYFDPCSKDESQKRIAILSEKMNEEAKKLMKHFYRTPHRVTNTGNTVPMLEEISQLEAHTIYLSSSIEKSKSGIMKNSSLETTSLLVFPPKHKGAVTITIDDYNCLEEEQFLNDVIIDFYLKWLVTNKLPDNMRAKTHVFSTFFYKRLTAKPGKSHTVGRHENDPTLTPAQRRHARVKSWTKGVDIFQKDFIIIPINEHSHWFLVIICFPGLHGPVKQTDNQQAGQKLNNDKRRKTDVESQAPVPDGEWSDRDEASGEDEELLDFEDETEVQKTQPQNNAKPSLKQPCILVFDSLRGANRSRILATLREYLTVEYRHRRGIPKCFSEDAIKGGVPLVPQQTNLSDCGLYTLHFAESFFDKPLQDYRLPIKYLASWFPQEAVDKKREDIAKLIKTLMDQYRPNHGIKLPALFQQNGSPESRDSLLKCVIENNTAKVTPAQNTAVGFVESVSRARVEGSNREIVKNIVITPTSFAEVAATSNKLHRNGSPSRKMQPEIIRDSETSEVLLIVNPTSESPASSVSNDKTVTTVNAPNYRFMSAIKGTQYGGQSNVAPGVRTVMPSGNLQQFPNMVVATKATLTASGVQRQFSLVPNTTVTGSGAQSLLNLAEIASSRERNISCNVASHARCRPNVSSTPIHSPITSSTNYRSYDILASATSRSFTLPSMTNVLNRVVSSGGNVTVSSPAVRGLVSSSKIIENSFVPNRALSPAAMQNSPWNGSPSMGGASVSNLNPNLSNISNLPRSVETTGECVDISATNKLSHVPAMAIEWPTGPTRLRLDNDDTECQSNLLYKVPTHSSLLKTQSALSSGGTLPAGNLIKSRTLQTTSAGSNVVINTPKSHSASVAPTLPQFVPPPPTDMSFPTERARVSSHAMPSISATSPLRPFSQGLSTLRDSSQLTCESISMAVNLPNAQIPSPHFTTNCTQQSLTSSQGTIVVEKNNRGASSSHGLSSAFETSRGLIDPMLSNPSTVSMPLISTSDFPITSRSLNLPAVSMGSISPTTCTPLVSSIPAPPIVFTPSLSTSPAPPIICVPSVSTSPAPGIVCTPSVSSIPAPPSVSTPSLSTSPAPPIICVPAVSTSPAPPIACTPSVFRFNTRNTSSGRTIATPKRYLDYPDVPATKRRTKAAKFNAKGPF